jgi:hypothetical protein
MLTQKQSIDFIGALPTNRALQPEDVLRDEVLLHRDAKISLYYAPLDYLSTDAKVVIAGITPGLQQTIVAYEIARNAILNGGTLVEAEKLVKKAAAFAGTMRRNLVYMLDGIGLPTVLGLHSTSELFDDAYGLAHFTSVVGYPAFSNATKNYPGHGPAVVDHPVLRQLLEEKFAKEIQMLGDCLIVPLGKSVEKCIGFLSERGAIDRSHCLFGFPHPSGGNGHRLKFYLDAKERLSDTVRRNAPRL